MIRLIGTVKKSHGFTLVEIMIVILIISVILFIAVPSWIGARERSHIRACIGQLRELKYAKETWAMENNKTSTDTPTMSQLLVYIKSTPSCPAGGTYTIGSVNIDPSCSVGGDHSL